MFKGSTAAVVAAGALWAGQASAAQMIYDVTLTGHLVSGTDADGILHVGDTITLTTRFTDDYAVQWGDTGYTLAGIGYSTSLFAGPDDGPPPNPLPLSGPLFWRIDVGPYFYSYSATDDPYEFYDYYREVDYQAIRRRLEGPVLALKDGLVAGFYSEVGIDGTFTPALHTGGYEPYGVDRRVSITGGPTSTQLSFSPVPADGEKFRIAGIAGVWDLSSSIVTITPVPEPSAWAMMLLGFFGVGAAIRGRRSGPAMA